MAKIKTKPWDVVEHLATPEDQAGYLQAAFEDGDLRVILKAVSNVVRARGGMRQLARTAELGETTLYKIDTDSLHTEFSTILKAIQAIGLQMTVMVPPVIGAIAKEAVRARSHRKAS
jgi:probable addiction module antidote protein